MTISNATLLKALHYEVKDKCINDKHADYAIDEVLKHMNEFPHESNDEFRLAIFRASLRLAGVPNQSLTGEQCTTMIKTMF